MPRYLCTVVILFVAAHACAQYAARKQPGAVRDTLQLLRAMPENMDLPYANLGDNIRAEDAIAVLPSMLASNNDLLLSFASFHFSTFRFRVRGYASEWSPTVLNGIPMNNPEDGNTPWAYWSGLNDVTRSTRSFPSLAAIESDFGGIGQTTVIDMRASKQRQQKSVGYSFSNRSYVHRWTGSYGSGFDKKGWAFSVSGSYRYAPEAYFPGTFLRGAAYYLAVDRKLANGDIVSLTVFGSPSTQGRMAAVTEAARALGGAGYNPNWGYDRGLKRNAATGYSHIPVAIFNYECRIGPQQSWLFSLSSMNGTKSSSSLDWYNAPDPRPDYYRYLPAYYHDSALQASVTMLYANDPEMLQLDWDEIYQVNRNSYELTYDVDGEPGKTFAGARSHFILQEAVTAISRIDAALQYQWQSSDNIALTAGCSAQWQRAHHYKQVKDLLGGEYYVDWNQFAEGDVSVIQNDLGHPNRILRAGDRYGYNYLMVQGAAKAWAQAAITRKRFDWVTAARLGYAMFYRNGLVRTGLFPGNSFGRSVVYEFTDLAVKGGVTWKIDGRRYAWLNAIFQLKPPLPDNVLVSPRTRDQEQENITMQQVCGMDAGYKISSPALKMKLAAYITRFTNGMNVLTFYHDENRTFVNYAITGISQLHYGLEAAAECSTGSPFTLMGAAAIGRCYYDGRPSVTVTADNDAYVLGRDIMYLKNYRAGGSPQEAYALRIAYQSERSAYANITVSYFREHWLEINPVRRTYGAVSGITPGSEAWQQALDQQKLPQQYTVDLSGGHSFRRRLRSGKYGVLSVYVSVSNLLDKKNMVSGGYEQLRFDAADVNKFPAKYYYAMGLNFSVNVSWRF